MLDLLTSKGIGVNVFFFLYPCHLKNNFNIQGNPIHNKKSDEICEIFINN